MADSDPAPDTGLIGWFAANPVAANLLMLLIVVAGSFGLILIRTETVPEIDPNRIEIEVLYPGAAPQEVEESIVVKIEQAVQGIEGIEETRATARENLARVVIRVREGYAAADVIDQVKMAVDTISTFPREAERPTIRRQLFRRKAVNLQVYGNVSERQLTEYGEQLRDEIAALDGISYTELWGARPFEIVIEISDLSLRRYGLTLQDVANRIGAASLNLAGGTIRADAGDIRLRALGQAYTGEDFRRIVLIERPDGTRVTIGDIANVSDGFAEMDFYAFFDGRRSLGIAVFALGDENEVTIAHRVKAWAEQRRATLPPGIELSVWADHTVYLEQQMRMMLTNLAMGAVLVFVLLGLFLNVRVAFWVIVGLPVALLGALMLMPLDAIDVSINLLSLFAFILVLGIVVDDAIVIGEAAYREVERDGMSLAAVVRGARRVAVPATFGVLTTIVTFVPLLTITGPVEPLARSVGVVVVLCLTFSLIESKLILPSHLAAMPLTSDGRPSIGTRALDWFSRNLYEPLLARAIEQRYTTLALFVALVVIVVALVAGGRIRYVFFVEIGADFVSAQAELVEGAPESLIHAIAAEMNAALRAADADLSRTYGQPVVKHLFEFVAGGKSARFQVELNGDLNGRIDPAEVERAWRAHLGAIGGLEAMSIRGSRDSGGGPPVAYKLSGRDPRLLKRAAAELTRQLEAIDGVFEVSDSTTGSSKELRISLTPQADAAGLTLAEVARQVRQAFHGAEAQRIQRGDHEIKVMVRYPRAERSSIGDLEHMWLRAADGREVPFVTVARIDTGAAPGVIQRIDGARAVSVSARVDAAVVEPRQVTRAIEEGFGSQLHERFPGVSLALDGGAREERETTAGIIYGFVLALIGIYTLLAIPLRSYLQPVIVMAVIPFGIIGAVVGHGLMGYPLSAISVLGIVALSGVVVNDALIMVHFVNAERDRGEAVVAAARRSGVARLRAIVLTSLTTFFGLVPLLAERAVSAQIVIPMATSLAFGILFATVITLVLVPCLYVMLDDLTRLGEHLRHGRSPVAAPN